MENPQEPRFSEAKLNLPLHVCLYFCLSLDSPSPICPLLFCLRHHEMFKWLCVCVCVWLAGRGLNIPAYTPSP